MPVVDRPERVRPVNVGEFAAPRPRFVRAVAVFETSERLLVAMRAPFRVAESTQVVPL